MTTSRPAVLYVVGAGHSGSTLLDLMLGGHPDVQSLGELATYDDYFGPADGPMPWAERGCTCGVHVSRCPFWAAVRRRIGDGPVPARDGDGFAARTADLLGAVAAVTGKRFVCDSSKDLRRLAALRRAGVVARAIHLVRDGRGVAYSYQRLADAGAPHPPPWHGYDAALLSWAELTARVADDPDTRTVRYEDLVASPTQVLSDVLAPLGLGVEPAMLRFWDRRQHNLCGNRMRMRPTPGLRYDDAYLTALPPAALAVREPTLAAALRRFGYPPVVGESPAAPA